MVDIFSVMYFILVCYFSKLSLQWLIQPPAPYFEKNNVGSVFSIDLSLFPTLTLTKQQLIYFCLANKAIHLILQQA